MSLSQSSFDGKYWDAWSDAARVQQFYQLHRGSRRMARINAAFEGVYKGTLNKSAARL
jgi:hypothetical protein